MRLLAQATDREVELLVQFFQVAAHQVAHLHVLEVMPAPLIPRVQVGRVPRRRLQADRAARVRHERQSPGARSDASIPVF